MKCHESTKENKGLIHEVSGVKRLYRR